MPLKLQSLCPAGTSITYNICLPTNQEDSKPPYLWRFGHENNRYPGRLWCFFKLFSLLLHYNAPSGTKKNGEVVSFVWWWLVCRKNSRRLNTCILIPALFCAVSAALANHPGASSLRQRVTAVMTGWIHVSDGQQSWCPTARHWGAWVGQLFTGQGSTGQRWANTQHTWGP